jgi:hypothetical protein
MAQRIVCYVLPSLTNQLDSGVNLILQFFVDFLIEKTFDDKKTSLSFCWQQRRKHAQTKRQHQPELYSQITLAEAVCCATAEFATGSAAASGSAGLLSSRRSTVRRQDALP